MGPRWARRSPISGRGCGRRLAGAFDGVDVVFLVTPIDDRIEIRERTAVQAAQMAGVRQVVKVYGAVRHDGDPLDVLHEASVDAIIAPGPSWALVSPNSVMESSLLSQAEGIKQAGICSVPWAAEGSVSSPSTTSLGRWPLCHRARRVRCQL